MIRAAFRRLLTLDDPPERTALAFTVGVFVGFSPFLGLHTAIAAILALIFRFNKVAIFTGVYINNPLLTLVPIVLLSYAIGAFVLGRPLKPPAELWAKGLGGWQQDGARIQRFRDAAEVAIYTPGSNAGLPVSILKSFAAPAADVREDGELLRERISTTVPRRRRARLRPDRAAPSHAPLHRGFAAKRSRPRAPGQSAGGCLRIC